MSVGKGDAPKRLGALGVSFSHRFWEAFLVPNCLFPALGLFGGASFRGAWPQDALLGSISVRCLTLLKPIAANGQIAQAQLDVLIQSGGLTLYGVATIGRALIGALL